MMRTLLFCVLAACSTGSSSNNPDSGGADTFVIPNPNGMWSMVVTENPTGCSSMMVNSYAAGTVTIANNHLDAKLFSFSDDAGACSITNSVSIDIDANSVITAGTETSTSTCGCKASVPVPNYVFHINQAATKASFSLNNGGVTLTKM